MDIRPILGRERPLSLPGHRVGLAFDIALLAGGRTSIGTDLPPLTPEAAGPYRLGNDDQAGLPVFDDARLAGDVRMADRGALASPLVGAIPVLSRTMEQAAQVMEETRAAQGLVNGPSTSRQVAQYRPMFVLGTVERNGQRPRQPGMTAHSGVAVRGGFKDRAITDDVSLTGLREDGQAHDYRTGRSTPLQPGDAVNVVERRF
jgi:polysaccharide export outer membrane protein